MSTAGMRRMGLSFTQKDTALAAAVLPRAPYPVRFFPIVGTHTIEIR